MKATYLVFIGVVSVHDYGQRRDFGFSYTPGEYGLVVMLCSSLLYEFGQMQVRVLRVRVCVRVIAMTERILWVQVTGWPPIWYLMQILALTLPFLQTGP